MQDTATSKKVRPWWDPPSLLLHQAGSLLLVAFLTGWKKAPIWIVRHALSCIPGAAGSTGMGCIGFPSHPVIELTESCNLSCIHCHAGSPSERKPELSTGEVFRLLDELAQTLEFRMVAFTGGEPLLRSDLFEILEHASSLGFSPTLATNGTLLTPGIAEKLARAGVAIVAVSLDATDASTHDRIRGKEGSFAGALAGMKAVVDAGMTLHINVTIASYNETQVSDLIHATESLGAAILIVYQLIPVGRGEKIADRTLGLEANRRLISSLITGQKEVAVIIEPVGGPQYWAELLSRRGIRGGAGLKLAEQLFHGCCAGRGFVYIKPDGEVLPCPFIPVSCGNIRDTPFDVIYRESALMKALQNRDNLTGSCGECPYKEVCGGCRGRAYAISGDIFAEDPACFIRGGLL